MDRPTILILGGYGNTGSTIAHLLLQHTDARIIIAGRNGYKIDVLTRHLAKKFPAERIAGARADAADPDSLHNAFFGADLVVVASATARYMENVALACLETGADCLDLQYSSDKLAVLRGLEPDMEYLGRCFITDAGFHPGIPAALVRYISRHFEALTTATVAGILRPQGGFPYSPSVVEMVNELGHFDSSFYRDGQWQKTRWTYPEDRLSVRFEEPFGEQSCTPMHLEEMRILPALYPTLRETGFVIAGFDTVTDNLVLPEVATTVHALPGLPATQAHLLSWSTRTFSHPPYGAVLQLEATGRNAGKPETATLVLYHHDPTHFTAIPVVATILQWQERSTQIGLHFAAHFVEPIRFLKDMERLGMHISGTHWPGSWK